VFDYLFGMGYGWLKPGRVQNIFLGLTILASLAAPFLVLTALVALAIRQRGNPWAVIVQAGLCAAICIPAKVDEEAIFFGACGGAPIGCLFARDLVGRSASGPADPTTQRKRLRAGSLEELKKTLHGNPV
jgi:hypothetical protein